MTPQIRLILRALVAGVTVFAEQLKASQSWDSALLRSAIVAGVLASLEYVTPLNALVGPGKSAVAVPAPPAPPTTIAKP